MVKFGKYTKKFKSVVKPKKSSEFKKKVKSIVKSEISAEKQNKWFNKAAGLAANDNRVDLTGSLGSSFEVTSLIRKNTTYLTPLGTTVELPRSYRLGNKIKILGIQYRLIFRSDQTAGSEGWNRGRLLVCASVSQTITSAGNPTMPDFVEDYTDFTGDRFGIQAGDVTCFPLDWEIIDKVYADKEFYSNTSYNGGNDFFLDREPIKEGYIRIGRIFHYNDASNVSTYNPATNARLYVAFSSNSSAAPHPILEGYYRIIFEDMD